MFEVEVKARCLGLEPKILSLGAEFLGEECHEDMYFNSPWRDFSKTDEALRVRKVNEKYFLAYKGPKFDSETKAREELEFEVDPKIMFILERLGFRKVASVTKRRRLFSFRGLRVCLDYVDGLGEFIEVESDDLSAKQRIFDFLESLGIKKEDTIRKSYLELLCGL